MTLVLTQARIYALKVAPLCANKVAKEKKKKNMTNLVKCYGPFQKNISNYLFNIILE